MFDLKARLQRTRDGFVSPLKRVFQRKAKLTLEDQEEVEELLIGSDVGVEACDRIMDALKSQDNVADYQSFLREEFTRLLVDDEPGESVGGTGTRALVIVGVNGVGKTTSIAKLGHYYRQRGKRVILAAGTLGTARIVLRSLDLHGTRLPLVCNPHTYVAMLNLSMLGRPARDARHSMAQLCAVYAPDGEDGETTVGHLYSYRSLHLFRL